nr:uncharacterized protein LOC113818178 [Penaeus vannamei]
MAATTFTMSQRDPMRTILLLATMTLQLTECSGSVSVDRLLWSLQERMQGGTSAPQWSAALKSFKTFSCTARRDGMYPDLATDCTLYYRCLDGAVYSYSCPSGEGLGYGSESCRPAAEVTCPRLPPSTPPCLNQTNGYYPDYTQGCRGYYRCDNGSVNGRWFCENSGLWDVATGSCGSGSGLTCTPPSCWGLPDGPHPTPASSCTAYFTCQAGVRTDHVCPYGTIFDYSLKRCVPSSSSVCYEQACEGRVNGFHAAPHASCRAFFRCFNGALVELQECPRHQIFDGQRCVSATNFSCWGEGRGSCEGRDDGLFAASDCRGFFRCRHQQFIRAFLCSRGLVFNGRECVEDTNALCTSQAPRPDCANKIDGYYTVEKTGCRTFFSCRGGRKISEHTCPGTNVFNGEQCVDPVLYPCPASRPPLAPLAANLTNRVARSLSADADCASRPNGYYLDVPSRCTRFFYCHEGAKQFVRSCPPGERFNGLGCVSQDSYKCPVIAGAPECLLRGDGVYQDLESGCSSYYQCFSGVKIEFKCPEGRLHSGRACEPAAQVFCPAATLCSHQRLNATLVDTDRGCQGYFRCQEDVLLCAARARAQGGRCSTGRSACPTSSTRARRGSAPPAWPNPTVFIRISPPDVAPSTSVARGNECRRGPAATRRSSTARSAFRRPATCVLSTGRRSAEPGARASSRISSRGAGGTTTATPARASPASARRSGSSTATPASLPRSTGVLLGPRGSVLAAAARTDTTRTCTLPAGASTTAGTASGLITRAPKARRSTACSACRRRRSRARVPLRARGRSTASTRTCSPAAANITTATAGSSTRTRAPGSRCTTAGRASRRLRTPARAPRTTATASASSRVSTRICPRSARCTISAREASRRRRWRARKARSSTGTSASPSTSSRARPSD